MQTELAAKLIQAQNRLAASEQQYRADLAQFEELTQLVELWEKHIGFKHAAPKPARPKSADTNTLLPLSGVDAIEAVVYVLKHSETIEVELSEITKQMIDFGWSSAASNPTETVAMAIRRLGDDNDVTKVRRGVYALRSRYSEDDMAADQLLAQGKD